MTTTPTPTSTSLLQIRKEIDSSFDLLIHLLNERRNVLLSSLEIERSENDEEPKHQQHLSFTLDLDTIKKVISSSGELNRNGPVASRSCLTLTAKEGKEVSLLVRRRTQILLHLRHANGEPFSSSSSSSSSGLKKMISLSLIQEKEEQMQDTPLEFEIESDEESSSNGSHLISFTPSQEGIPSLPPHLLFLTSFSPPLPHLLLLTHTSSGFFLLEVLVNNTPIPGSPFPLQVHSLQSHYSSLDSRSSSISSIGLNISEGQFQCPRGLCLDTSSSLLFVADEDSSRILTFSTKNGGDSFLSSFKLDTSPHCLALFPSSSSSSSLLLVTCGDNSVRIYEAPEGRLVRYIQLSDTSSSASASSSSSSSFRNPWGVFIDKEEGDEEGREDFRVFVADTSNHRVVIFRCSLFESESADGNKDQILRILGTQRGSEEGELMAPVGVCCDSEGEVFVVENGNSRISQFSSKTGEFRRKTFWEAGLLEYPWGIALDGRDSNKRGKGETTGEEEEEERLIVCDWGNNRLVVFNKKTGEVMARIVPKNSEELVSPLYVEIEKEEGRIYVSDSNGIQTF